MDATPHSSLLAPPSASSGKGARNYSSTEDPTRRKASALSDTGSSPPDYDGSTPDRAGSTVGNGAQCDASIADDSGPRTSASQAFVHLLKGYVGPGCLSLPWAVSKLGIVPGTVAIGVMSFWSSCNCWTIVEIKQYIERSAWEARRHAGGAETKSEGASSAATSSALTYPDVGEWAYGDRFEAFLAACICTQQLAICTVYFSFIGENILAVCRLVPDEAPRLLSSHVGVMTAAFPSMLGLSFVPHLRALAPVIALAALLLFAGFLLLGAVVLAEWGSSAEPVERQWKEAPLALCAILYSYEGICLILPIESTMQEPKKFKTVFASAMMCSVVIFATVANLCVHAFGEVTNGSITAFLLEKYKDDKLLLIVLMITNTVVSFSVLFTYPLQLFPTFELVGPKARAIWWKLRHLRWRHDEESDNDEKDLTGFDVLPTLPEHDVASLDSRDNEHMYENSDNGDAAGGGDAPPAIRDGSRRREEDSETTSIVTGPSPTPAIPGDSARLRAGLVLLTYAVAVLVPNVQALIALAGALSGSSTALLIPPMLELALIDRLEARLEAVASPRFLPTSRQNHAPSSSPFRRLCQCDISGKFWKRKLKNLFLFWIGFVFMVIGTYASLSDIVQIWRTHNKL